jgi:glycosyltransferase involved in cell wall biosynthesis
MYTTAAKTLVTGKSYWATIWFNRSLRMSAQQLHAAQRFQVVHCDWLQPAVSLRGLDLPLVIRTLDVHFVGMRQGAEGRSEGNNLRKLFWRSQAERFRRFEAQMLAEAPAVVTLSAEDEVSLRGEGVSKIVTIPPPREIMPQAPHQSTTDESSLALFVGRLDMEVNREAFFVFADEVWPRIGKDIRSRARVIFAGGFPSEEMRRRAIASGFELHAPLSDLEASQLFARADIFLSPVQSGTGIKIKTLEAMAHGKAMIGFPGAFRGVPIEHNRHALVADTPADFANLFESLVRDRAQQRQIGTAAREFIRVNFNPEVLGAQLINLYERVAEGYAHKQQPEDA